MIGWWWLLAAFAAGWILRSVPLARERWRLVREAAAWAVEASSAWARIDQLEDEVDRLEHEKATAEQLNDAMFDDEARRLLG